MYRLAVRRLIMSKNYTSEVLKERHVRRLNQFLAPRLHPKPEIVFAFTLMSSFKITGLETCMISTAVSYVSRKTKGNQIILE